jgi:pimeloyl-ACP methyl ester carboxylesterase
MLLQSSSFFLPLSFNRIFTVYLILVPFTYAEMLSSCFGQESAPSDISEKAAYTKKFESLIQIEELQDTATGRTITYGVGGDPNGTPILFFPPLSATYRMMLFIHDDLVKFSLKAICVNRPGILGTSPASSIRDHAEKTCSDAITILDSLQINRVGILCMCAGSTFAMKFSVTHPQRTTGKLLGFAPWTLPADCPHSKKLHRFAANHLPVLALGNIIGRLEVTMMGFLSKETIASKIDEACSEEEGTYLNNKFSHESSHQQAFLSVIDWVMGEPEPNAHDLAVCLSSSKSLGLDYQQIKCDAVFWQGDNDHMAPVLATEWLASQFVSTAKLNIVPEGTHSGALFVLDSRISDSLQTLH